MVIDVPELKPHALRHGVEVYGEHGDLEEVRALLGHQRIDTTQIYARIRPTELNVRRTFWTRRPTGC